jgi:hypothetical protein
MKQDIGINQRIPMNVLELALLSALQGNASAEYYRELASIEYSGQNRITKAVSVINRLTIKNPILPYLIDNKTAVESMLRSKTDRPLLLTAVICSAYSFSYDLVSLLGKYFHAQEYVTTDFIKQKMAAKYGSNRSLPNALYCILPMLIEAQILDRPESGVYKPIKITKATENALNVFKKSFLLNNPMLTERDNIESNSYFEFIKA